MSLISAGPTISQFAVQDYYYRNSNHSLSCTATFGDNSTTGLDIQLCLGSFYKPILEDPAFTLNQSSDNEASRKCLRQKTVSYTFSFLQVSNGTSVRCVGTDDDLKENATTECVPLILQPPGKSLEIVCLSAYLLADYFRKENPIISRKCCHVYLSLFCWCFQIKQSIPYFSGLQHDTTGPILESKH